MDDYTKNLKCIEYLKTFMGGDNEDIPLFDGVLDDMRFIVEHCKKFNIPQPEIFPWAGGDGVQAEWEYDWYLEIDSHNKGISILFVKGKDYDNAISCKLYDIEDAFMMVKTFINNVVDIDGIR